jgi:hypothetical protein
MNKGCINLLRKRLARRNRPPTKKARRERATSGDDPVFIDGTILVSALLQPMGLQLQ